MLQKQILVLFILLTNLNLLGQNTPKDSSLKTITLDEVSVCDLSEEKDQTFDFYKNNKLATTEDILSRMQGVNLIKRGAYGLEPTLRNYNSGQTNLTIDGMKIYGACTDKMDPVSIYVEPSNLSAIQVAHGASGTMNGSNIGGQINMQLREPTLNCHSKLSGQISQTYLSVNNAYYASAALQHSTEKIAYRVNGTYRKANDYKAGGNLHIPYSGFEKYNIGGNVLFKVSKAQLIKIDYIGDWGKNIGYPALPMDVGSATAHITSLTHQLHFKNSYFTKNELKFYYNQITHFMDDTHRPNVPMHMDMPGWTKTTGMYNELFASDKLKIRIDFHNVYARADMTMYPTGEPIMYMQTLPENNLNNAGLAIKYKLDLKHKQQLNFNARTDYYLQSAVRGIGYKQWKVFNTNITNELEDVLKSGNISYSKTFLDKLLIQLSVGYGERLATSNERYGYYLFNRQDQYDYIGNILLKPEQSYQSELLIKHSLKKIDYSFNFFYHHISNYIYSYQLNGMSAMTIGAKGLKSYKNINYATSMGGEFNLKYHIIDNLTYINSIKYIYTETFDGKPLPLIPPLKLQHALRYKLNLFQFQVEHDYAIKQDRINSDYGDVITPEYHLFNLRAARNFRIKSSVIQFSLACENIFDVRYREHLDIGQVPRFGRNFTANLNFIF